MFRRASQAAMRAALNIEIGGHGGFTLSSPSENAPIYTRDVPSVAHAMFSRGFGGWAFFSKYPGTKKHRFGIMPNAKATTAKMMATTTAAIATAKAR